MPNHYRHLFATGLLALLGLGRVQAQTNYRPGYVLPLTGDTLRGEVDLREGRLNAERCQFRANPQAAPVLYLPANLRGYGFSTENQHYRALTATTDKAAARPYFLEILADGPVSLYHLVDEAQREQYYVGLPNQPLALLRHGLVEVMRGNERTMEVETGYRNTLAAVLTNCPAVEQQLPRLSFQESQLIKVVNAYNRECAGYRPAQARHTSKAHFTVGIMAGVAQHVLEYSDFPYKNGVTARRSQTGMAVGPTLCYGWGPRLALSLSILYSPDKFVIEDAGKNSLSGQGFRHTFDLAYLRFPLMVRYTYPRGKFVPMAEAGLSLAYAVKANNTAEEADYRTGIYKPASPYTTGVTGEGFRAVETGYGAGLGVGTHVAGGRAVAFWLRAEKTNGFAKSTGVSTAVLHLFGLLSVDLTK